MSDTNDLEFLIEVAEVHNLKVIHCVYMDDEDIGSSKGFFAVCEAVPRIGEHICPEAGSDHVEVMSVYHKITTSTFEGRPVRTMTMNVVVREIQDYTGEDYESQ